MTARLVFAARDELLCVALADDSGVTDLYTALATVPEQSGAVVQATVTQLRRGQGAAIVRHALGEGYWADAAAKNAKVGAVMRLQIKTEPTTDKLPQLGRDITLPGRYFVHLPQGRGVKFSRTREAAALPDCLADMPGGWIIRRSAAAAPPEQLAQEAAALARQGALPEIPALTYWQRAILEHGSRQPALLVEDVVLLRRMQHWLAEFASDLLPLCQLSKDALDWDAVLAEATAASVALPDGARLSIEQTRALCAVDVDAGAASSHLAVNSVAARALARHLRLRNIGGIIVVDFINLKSPAERNQLMQTLRAAVADDPAGVAVFGLSKLGLVEMTRNRRGCTLSRG